MRRDTRNEANQFSRGTSDIISAVLVEVMKDRDEIVLVPHDFTPINVLSAPRLTLKTIRVDR